jgi:hypothetical protein
MRPDSAHVRALAMPLAMVRAWLLPWQTMATPFNPSNGEPPTSW